MNIYDLCEMPPEEAIKLIARLPDAEKLALAHNWSFWARPEQLPPPGDWRTWVFLGGRGAGKTRGGAEFIRQSVKDGYGRIALVAQTAADAREVMIDGESGLRAVCWEGDRDYRDRHIGRPEYQPSRRRLVWPNGAVAYSYSAEDPEQLRGPQHDLAWADEYAAWENRKDVWSNLQFGLRLKTKQGFHPRQMVTTTPRPLHDLKAMLERPDTVRTHGGTRSNRTFLSEEFLESVEGLYGGSRLGRQELLGELVMEVEGAYWTTDMFDQRRITLDQLPNDLDRVVVAVDPSGAASANDTNHDEIGIVGAGLKGNARQGAGYVIKDSSLLAGPKDWANRAVNLYYALNADKIVAEINYGGAMVVSTIKTVDPNVPVKVITATRGKVRRAEPVSALYDSGRVCHVGNLGKLEDQLCQFTADGYQGDGSPDRADAAIWALTELMISSVNTVTKVAQR